jgi:hypothetical protein
VSRTNSAFTRHGIPALSALAESGANSVIKSAAAMVFIADKAKVWNTRIIPAPS